MAELLVVAERQLILRRSVKSRCFRRSRTRSGNADESEKRSVSLLFLCGRSKEPPHSHVQRDDAEAKFWLSPVRLAWNRGFSGAELRRIERITEEKEPQLMEGWNEYFGIGR